MNLYKRCHLIVLLTLLAISGTVFSRDSDGELSEEMSEDESKKIEQPANDPDHAINMFMEICREFKIDEKKINTIKTIANDPGKKIALSHDIFNKINDIEFTPQGAEKFTDKNWS